MKFAQLYEGKIIYFEEADSIADLKRKYNPNTNWIDATNIECGLGWTVTHNAECELVFTPPAKPNPPTFEELKLSKLNEAHLLFEQKRDSKVWVDTSIGRLGFDTANEDITNFMAARLDAVSRGRTEYKVWLKEGTDEKGIRTIPIADLDKAFTTARKSQMMAYAWFEKVRAKIKRCSTTEELNALNLEENPVTIGDYPMK